MILEDASVIEGIDYVFKGLFGAVLAYFGYTGNKLVNSVARAHEKADANNRELAAHKLHVSETYSKEANTQQSLARLHDRIDENNKDTKQILNILLTMKK